MGRVESLRRFEKLQRHLRRQAAGIRTVSNRQVVQPDRPPRSVGGPLAPNRRSVARQRDLVNASARARRVTANRIGASKAVTQPDVNGQRVLQRDNRRNPVQSGKDRFQQAANDFNDRARRIEYAKRTGRTPNGKPLEGYIDAMKTQQLLAAEAARGALQELYDKLADNPNTPSGKLDEVRQKIGHFDSHLTRLSGYAQARGLTIGSTSESERASERVRSEEIETDRREAEAVEESPDVASDTSVTDSSGTTVLKVASSAATARVVTMGLEAGLVVEPPAS